jgi:hypothetical protein
MMKQLFPSLGLVVALSVSAGGILDAAAADDNRPADCGAVANVTGGRCLVERAVSDSGPAYDAQGNLVDRYGNVVAVPASAQNARQVFVSEPRL